MSHRDASIYTDHAQLALADHGGDFAAARRALIQAGQEGHADHYRAVIKALGALKLAADQEGGA